MLIKVFISACDKCCETIMCLTFQCHVFMEKQTPNLDSEQATAWQAVLMQAEAEGEHRSCELEWSTACTRTRTRTAYRHFHK